MGDIDDHDSFCLEPANHLEKPSPLRLRQRRSWFIKYDDSRFVPKRPGDFHELPITDAEFLDTRFRGNRGPKSFHQLLRATAHFRRADKGSRCRQAIDKDILG